jgi:hypothetical protein
MLSTPSISRRLAASSRQRSSEGSADQPSVPGRYTFAIPFPDSQTTARGKRFVILGKAIVIPSLASTIPRKSRCVWVSVSP